MNGAMFNVIRKYMQEKSPRGVKFAASMHLELEKGDEETDTLVRHEQHFSVGAKSSC